MKTKSINKMKNTTLKMMMIAITGLFLASLNNVAHAAEKKSFESVASCVGEDRTGYHRIIKNNCDFGIAVWVCEKSKWDCGSNTLNAFYKKRYSSLFHIKPYGTAGTGFLPKHGIQYVACGDNGVNRHGWSIGEVIPNSNRLSCYRWVD